jgi:uncharacterized protein (DUF983 family)
MQYRRTAEVMGRALRLKCPSCGVCPLFKSFFGMYERCECCGLIFLREQGYFIGAIYVNIMLTEGLIAIAFLICILVLSASDPKLYAILFALAVLLPILFNRHSRAIWLSFDYLIDPPKEAGQGPHRLTG